MTNILKSALAMAALIAAGAHASGLPTYRVTLVTDAGLRVSCSALNARGEVAGMAVTNPRAEYGYDAVVVSHGHVHSYGYSHGALAAEAAGINAARTTVGHVITDQAFGFKAPTAWSADGRMKRLSDSGEAYAVNEAGDFVGWSLIGGGDSTATMWADGAAVNLAPALDYSEAYAINGHRQAVGAYYAKSHWSAVLFEGGAVIPLGTLGGSSAQAFAINEAGHIVGGSSLAGGGPDHAFLYADGAMRDLGAPAGRDSTAVGINASDVVVGYSSDSKHPLALVWIDGVVHVLDDLLDAKSGAGWRLVSANAINDAGQICADGNKGAALLTPMP